MKPILFSTPMVQAILEDRKNQTRRIIKNPPVIDQESGYKFYDGLMFDIHDNVLETLYMPEHAPIKKGETLWVRETWQHTRCLNINPEDENYGYVYRADGHPWDDYEGWQWKPSIFMPKEACRIFLKVANVRAERLEDITKEDAIAEGIESWTQQCQTRYKSYVEPMVGFWDNSSHLQIGGVNPAIASYRTLWAKINGFDSLNSNPWVWVYEFQRIKKPLNL